MLFEWVKSSKHYSHRHAWREMKSPCHEPKGVRKARMQKDTTSLKIKSFWATNLCGNDHCCCLKKSTIEALQEKEQTPTQCDVLGVA